MRTLGIGLACAALAACATPYQEEGFSGGVHAQRIDDDTAIVTSKGNGYTNSTLVKEYVLRRAAEETIKDGFDWFEIAAASDISRQGSVVLPGTYNSTTTATATGYGNAAYGTATTTGYSTPAQTINFTKPGVEVTVHMHKGEKPEGVRGYTAAKVLSYLVPPPKTVAAPKS